MRTTSDVFEVKLAGSGRCFAVGIVAGPRGIVRVVLAKRTSRAVQVIRGEFPDAARDRRGLAAVRRQLLDYCAGKLRRFRVRTDLSALPPFSRRAIESLAEIPYGKVASYSSIARRLGRRGGARAVGQAMARNPIPLILPCHRVVRTDGELGGFSAEEGVSLKKALLKLEEASV